MLKTNLEDAVRAHGFTSIEEFNRMVAEADTSTREGYQKFRLWQQEDGTKTGLQMLLGRSTADPQMHDIIRSYDWPWRRDCYLEGIVAKLSGDFIAFAITKRVVEGVEQPVPNMEIARTVKNGASMFDDTNAPRILVLKNAPGCFVRPTWFDLALRAEK